MLTKTSKIIFEWSEPIFFGSIISCKTTNILPFNSMLMTSWFGENDNRAQIGIKFTDLGFIDQKMIFSHSLCDSKEVIESLFLEELENLKDLEHKGLI